MEETQDHTVYEGLLALLQNEFPKTCAKCGRAYPTLESFVDETAAANHGTGLMGYDMGARFQHVAMMRNCSCGSTLMTFCCDRRDISETGVRRRAMFENLLQTLQARGIDALSAREQLLAYLRGEASPILESLGIPARPRSLQPSA
jgi:hypothetical protein